MELASILYKTEMIERTLFARLARIAAAFPAVLLTGPRQAGKSTLLKEFARGRYEAVTLDDLAERELARRDPALFFSLHKPPVLIAELQHAPRLMTAIKIWADSHPEKKGQFLLTASQKFHLMKGVQESLAGRVAVLNLLGLSLAEIRGVPRRPPFLGDDKGIAGAMEGLAECGPEALYETIWRGSFPALAADPSMDRDRYFASYTAAFIERDVRNAAGIADPVAFQNFMRAAAARTGRLLSCAAMAREAGIDQKTAKSWLGILETAGLVRLLHPFRGGGFKRIIKAPKLYFLDTGLCSYLTKWSSPETLAAGAMSGAILETFVFLEILKSWWNCAREPDVSFYRDANQREIDFVMQRDGALHPIGVNRSLAPRASAARNFSLLERLGMPVGTGVILDLRPDFLRLSRNLVSVPVTAI